MQAFPLAVIITATLYKLSNMLASAIICALFALPGRMPPLSPEASQPSPYTKKTNHITSFDDNPPFKGIVVLEDLGCPDLHRNRIRRHFLNNDNDKLLAPESEYEPPVIKSTTSTENILKHIVHRLAYLDAPVDAKEVAESIEFYLRSGKRAIGAARRILKNNNVAEQTMVVKDLCSGHGLTGMIFLACNPPERLKANMRLILVDQKEPQSHSILRDLITGICPWVNQDTVQFVETDLDGYVSNSLSSVAHDEASIIISTHACGSLTDDVIRYGIESKAASISVMPCCYTGTAKGTPYGVQRMFGISASADISRSFFLHDNGYHVDFAAIPQAITPMNRLIVAERRF